MTLPILAERSDPKKYVILWDQVSSGSEHGAQQAERIARQINEGAQAAAPTHARAQGSRSSGTLFGMPASITVNGQPAAAEAVAGLDAMTGMDLNGDGLVGGRGTASAGAASASEAAAAGVEDRFRHLQSLRDGNQISETEYQARRAEILEGP